MAEENLNRLARLMAVLRARHIEDKARARYLHERCGSSVAYWSGLLAGKRSFGERKARAIEEWLGLERLALDLDSDNLGRQFLPRQDEGFRTVAHEMSLPSSFHSLPRILWDDVVNHKHLPASFITALADDALSPTFPKGTQIAWGIKRRVLPGRLLLLQDQHGQLHARMCMQGATPNTWRAVALNSAYLSFESGNPHVTIVAVYKGVIEDDDL